MTGISAYRRRSALPADRIPHGEGGYFNYGCKCDVCRTAGSQHNARALEKRLAAAGRARQRAHRRMLYSPRRWTLEEDALASCPDLTAAQVAEMVGRTECAVSNRRKRLRAATRREED